MLLQARQYEAHVLTLWRKSQEAPLELLAAPQVRAAPVTPPAGVQMEMSIPSSVQKQLLTPTWIVLLSRSRFT